MAAARTDGEYRRALAAVEVLLDAVGEDEFHPLTEVLHWRGGRINPIVRKAYTMDSNIFISFSHEDKPYRDELVPALEAVATIRDRVWFDPPPDPLVSPHPLPKPPFSGKAKIAACDHLGDSWRKLTDYFEIAPAGRARFDRGDEPREVWEWLERRNRLGELPQGLIAIGRRDMVELLKTRA